MEILQLIIMCYLLFGSLIGIILYAENNPIKLKDIETIGDILVVFIFGSSILFGYLYTMLFKIYCKTIN